MPRYKLPSPASPNSTLTKRGSNWDSTIYHCSASNTFWLLHMDRQGNRFLYAYLIGGAKPVIDKKQKYPVPADWSGDPETIHVPIETINDIETQTADNPFIADELAQLLAEGDRILVTDSDDAVVGELFLRDGRLVMRRQTGFGLA
jgi:hypothetical protein